MRSTRSVRKRSAKQESDTLRSLQKIATRAHNNVPTKAPTDGIESSAERLGNEINRLHSWTLQLASEYHIQPLDLVRELEKRCTR